MIILATGYRNNYNWIQIYGVTDQQGSPLIHGVGEDAEYIISNYIK